MTPLEVVALTFVLLVVALLTTSTFINKHPLSILREIRSGLRRLFWEDRSLWTDVFIFGLLILTLVAVCHPDLSR